MDAGLTSTLELLTLPTRLRAQRLPLARAHMLPPDQSPRLPPARAHRRLLPQAHRLPLIQAPRLLLARAGGALLRQAPRLLLARAGEALLRQAHRLALARARGALLLVPVRRLVLARALRQVLGVAASPQVLLAQHMACSSTSSPWSVAAAQERLRALSRRTLHRHSRARLRRLRARRLLRSPTSQVLRR